jgi:Leucine-rich repeat (LRR) protein
VIISCNSEIYVTAVRLDRTWLEGWNERGWQGLSTETKMNLEKQNIESIDADTFKMLLNLNTIKLDHNQLNGELSQHLFTDLFNLQELSLSYNNLTSIHANAFKCLTNLTKIYLNNNKLIKLESRVFMDTIKLQDIQLNHNKIMSIDSDVFLNIKAG